MEIMINKSFSKLIVAAEREDQAAIWLDVMKDVDTVKVRRLPFAQLEQIQEMDAEILPGMFAHERYGGGPGLGESQILSTANLSEWHTAPDYRIPPWVVTPPPMTIKDGLLLLKGEPDIYFTQDAIGQSQAVYHSFKRIFAVIDAANANIEPVIHCAGFSADIIYSVYDTRIVAEAVKRAFQDIEI